MKKYLFLILLSLTYIACGSTNEANEEDGSGTGNPNISQSDMSTVKSLPDVDVTNLDVASTAASASGNFITHKGAEPGQFSRAGCEADSAKNQIFRNTKQMSFYQCFMKKADVPIGNNQYNYSVLVAPDEGNSSVQLRAGNFSDEGLKIDFCLDSSLIGEIRWQVVNGTLSGKFVEHFTYDEDKPTEIEKMKFVMTLALQSDANLQDGIDVTEVSQATFLEAIQSYLFGYGVMTFKYDASGTTADNQLNGWFRNEDEGLRGQINAEWNSANGCAKYSVSGAEEAWTSQQLQSLFNFPAQALAGCASGLFCYNGTTDNFDCTTENTCSFSSEDTEPYKLTASNSWEVINQSESNCYEEVSQQTLISASNTPPDVAFIDDWDCSTPSGAETTNIDLNQFNITDCLAIEEEYDDYMNETSCEIRGTQELQSSGN